jgi:hypothetical protein
MNKKLERGDTSNHKHSLIAEGIEFDQSSLDDMFINDLTYADTSNPGTFLPSVQGDKMLVKFFLAYEECLENDWFNGNYIAIAHVAFDQFWIIPA